MLPRAQCSRSLPIAPSTDEDLDDLHFAFNDRVDCPVVSNPDTILPRIRPFDDSDVSPRPRSKRILLEDTQTLYDASSRSSRQLAQLPSRCLRQRDPERHSSSNGMNSSSSRIRFHRSSSSLMDALSISSRMTSSYVCPFEPNLRSSSFVSFWREIVVEPAISWPPWYPWYLCLTIWRYVQTVSRAGRQYHLTGVLDPSRAKTLDLREVRVVRHNATLEAEGRGGDHAICHREIPMDAPEEPSVARQPDIEGNHLQTGMLEGTQLGERLVSSTFPADPVRDFHDHDGRKDASPLPTESGQLRPGSREDLFVVRGVVRNEERGIQDLSQSSSSRDSSRIFSIRSTVVVFDRNPPRSSRRGTGRRTIASPRSSTTSRLPSSIRCRLRNSIGIVVWPLRVTLTIFRLRSISGPQPPTG